MAFWGQRRHQASQQVREVSRQSCPIPTLSSEGLSVISQRTRERRVFQTRGTVWASDEWVSCAGVEMVLR